MRWVPQGNSKPKPFVPFVTKHLKKWYGGPVEVTSLSQLRRIEKECGVIWEPGSFDSEHYGCEEPYRENPPKFRIPYDA